MNGLLAGINIVKTRTQKMNTASNTFRSYCLTGIYAAGLAIFVAGSSALATELPPDVDKLLKQRNEAISTLNKRYVEELERLKLKYTKKGDLETANAIVELINATGASESGDKGKRPSESLEKLLMSKVWTYKSGDSVAQITFLEAGRTQTQGWIKDVKWSIENDQILVLHYADKNTCRFDFKDFSGTEVLGMTAQKSARYLAPLRNR